MDLAQQFLISLLWWDYFELFFLVAFVAITVGTRWPVALLAGGALGVLFALALFSDSTPLSDFPWNAVAWCSGVAAVVAVGSSFTLRWLARFVPHHAARVTARLRDCATPSRP